jgi:hypothetical protein
LPPGFSLRMDRARSIRKGGLAVSCFTVLTATFIQGNRRWLMAVQSFSSPLT